MRNCSRDTGPPTSLTTTGIECLQRRGQFFDGCNQECVYDVSFFVLSHHKQLEEAIYGQIFPILIFFVVIANVMVAVVLSKKHMITPTNVVLKYMAIADLCVGLVPLPWTFYYFTLRNNHHHEKLELWWCYLAKYSMDAVPPVFHNIAMWLTVLLAGQRFISISYPLHSRTLCCVRNVRIATLIIGVMSLLCGLPKSFDFYYKVYEGWAFTPSEDFHEQLGQWEYTRSCLVGFTPLLEVVGQTLFFNLYFWTRAVGFVIVPSVLLIILNGLLIRGISQAQERKARLVKEKRTREAQKQTDNNSTSLMLVVIVSIFLVVNLPQAAFMVILCVCNTFGIEFQLLQGIFPIVFLLANNMLVMATYPINFGIYCFMSSSFRQTFKALFCKGPLLKREGSLTMATATRSTLVTTNGQRIAKRCSDISVTPSEEREHTNTQRETSTLLPENGKAETVYL